MSKQIVVKGVLSPNILPPLAPYSHAILADNTLYFSGQIGMNNNQVVLDGIEAQTRQAMENIGHVLKAAGGSFKNVVKMTVLLANIEDFNAMNKVYREFLSDPLPARAAYQVARLPRDALVEIEGVAVIGDIVESKL